jgi:predicted ATPase
METASFLRAVPRVGPILGRERETAFPGRCLAARYARNGHVVVLSGEAGIGKSRLLEALVEHLRDTPHRLLRAQCSPYHGNTVLYPILQLLRHQLDLRRDLSDAENLQRVERCWNASDGPRVRLVCPWRSCSSCAHRRPCHRPR